MKKKISLISLGCEKNLVDSEAILGMLNKADYEIVTDFNESDVIIVNTCGFIDSAKEEAINTIFEVLPYQEQGTKIVVVGCLVQRYYNDLIKEIPEVDLWIPIREYGKMNELISVLLSDKKLENYCFDLNNRLISTPKHLVYVKISEGCNNRCAYCAIPLIRGSFVSRCEEDIVNEVKYLVKTNRKEICLISQDLTRYGSDLKDKSLASLLRKIIQIPGDYVIRLLYLYPDEITNELIEVIKENNKIIPYFDIPIQHASNKILKWMNRRGTKEYIQKLINYIRNEIPNAVIRTTIIVGFPHETKKDFLELIDFIKEVKFDHLGAFMYSKEEDTNGFSMNHQVSKKDKLERYNELMEVQKWISLEQNKKHLNKVYNVIIEGFDQDTKQYTGRAYMYAPDDIDGVIYIDTDVALEIGNVYECLITAIDFYDLKAILNKNSK